MKFLKRIRFSLRTLLVLLTAFSLWLGWHVHKSRQQKEAVQAIREYGGWIRYDFQFPSGSYGYADFDPNASSFMPTWALDAFGADLFHSVVQVNLNFSEDGGKREENSNPSSEALQHLPDLPNLRRLLLSGTQADDRSMRHLAKLSHLEELFMWDVSKVSDEGVEHLRKLNNLRYVHLTTSQITDDSLNVFAELPKLEGLCLQFSRFTDEGLKSLTGLQELESLWICGKNDDPSPITDDGLTILHGMKKLNSLGIQNTEVTPQGLDAFKAALPNCRVISE